MPIGIGEDHEELRRTARRWIDTRCPPEVPRALLDAASETLPPFWDELAAQGWLGIHVPEEYGGQGFGLSELAVVVEELARAAVPGPVLPTMLAAAVLAGSSDPGEAKELLPRIVDGSRPAVVSLPGSGVLSAVTGVDGSVTLNGTVRPVLAAGAGARLLLVPATDAATPDVPWWCAVELDAPGVSVEPLASLDPTRRVAAVVVTDAVIGPERRLAGVSDALVRQRALTIAAAECAGGARWCLETATAYAQDRRQFGRPIGQFQAIKHRLADMLVSVEQVTALAWDAARATDGADVGQADLSALLAGALAFDAYVEAAKGCVQVLGGMGFTWEHDAHIHLRRALSLRQLHGGSSRLRVGACATVMAGTRRVLSTELPADAESMRGEIHAIVAEIAAASGTAEKRRLIVENGLLAPHWPVPYGRGAGPVEQLVIDEEMAAAGVFRPSIAVGAWALPTIIAHGTPAQQERFVGPTLEGKIGWCQLFSEPGAGSDLASLQMRAVRDGAGYVLTGQKVWTSMAQKADWGICLARTDPEAAKHDGITYFLVDMRSPGIEVRPLREITGAAMFNEVFFTEVFVPDDCVVGAVNGGWRLARTTLANERVSMSSGASFGLGIEAMLGALDSGPWSDDTVVLDQIGGLLAEAQSIALLGARTTLRSVSGVEPGPEASVRKLLGVEHEQRVQELGLVLLGAEGASTEGAGAQWSHGFLSTRCLTIAGGTSEVQRNVIGERMLGLPRDPEPGQ
jgi:3-oxochol-4-en-24-oyl-CoA dehydrogenase